MSIFNIFKKKKIEKIEVALDNVDKWIENKENELKDKEKSILNLLKEKIQLFNKELKDNIKELKEIDIDSRDANDRVKKIVKQNFSKYIEQATKLTEDLDELNYDNFEKQIHIINMIFINFEKKSLLNFQRSIYLLNKELVEIRKNIVSLSKYVSRILSQNKDIIEELRFIEKIKYKVVEKNENLKKIIDFKEKIKDTNEKIKEIEKEIKEVKVDPEKEEKIKKIKDINEKEENLKKEIHSLKEMIDFKELGNIYHINENKMKIIKDYKDRFEQEYLIDNGESIIKLLREAKFDNQKINDKVKEINIKKKEIDLIKESVKKNEKEDVFERLNKELRSCVEELENEKTKIEKIKNYNQETINRLKEDFSSRDIILVE